MVAKLLFPAFAKHHSAGYHAYLAGVVDFHEKVSDPAFRMRATMQHIESFSNLCTGDASQHWADSMRKSMAMASAMNEGAKAFWSAWFGGIGETMQSFSKAFGETKNEEGDSPSPVLDRSADGHVLSVRFRKIAG